MKKLGRHLIVELYGCTTVALNDLELIKTNMLRAAEICGATIVGEVFHKFSPQGVSGAVVIAESHFTIHTWPELGYAAMDFFTCGDSTNPWTAFAIMKDVLKADKEIVKDMDRGLLNTVAAGKIA
jgi:S-adenosylmethionine decarboxylase proenzyme